MLAWRPALFDGIIVFSLMYLCVGLMLSGALKSRQPLPSLMEGVAGLSYSGFLAVRN